MISETARGTRPWRLQRDKNRLATPFGRLVQNSAIYVIGSILPQLVSMLLLPIFTRYLTPKDYGILAYSMVAATFFSSLGSMSIQPFIIRHYFEARAAQDSRAFLGTTFAFLLGYNVLLLAMASVVLPSAFAFAHVQVPFYPYVQTAFISAALQVLTLVSMSYLRANERAVPYVTLAFVSSVLNGGLSLFLIVGQGMGVMGRFYGQLAGDSIMLAVHLVILSRVANLSWRPAYVRQALTFCLPLVPAQFLAMFSSMSDRLILERVVSLSQLGVYSVAAGIAATAPIVTSGVYSAIQPQIYSLAVAGRLDAQVPLIKKYFVWLFMGLMCVFIALSRDLVTLLAGPAFIESYRVVTLLVIAILIQSFITNLPSQYLNAVRQTKYDLPCRLGGLLVGLAVTFVLVRWFGILGAGVSAIVTALATLALYRWFLRSQSQIDWRFTRDLTRMGVAALVGYGLLQVQIGGALVDAVIKLAVIAAIALAYLVKASGSIRQILPSLGWSSAAQRP